MWHRDTLTSDGIVVKGPASYVVIIRICIPNIQVAMSLSATNLWLQVALISSPAVHSYGEDHSLSSQVWQMPFCSQ